MRPAFFECDEPATQQHHVVPRSRGGTRTVPLCDECHDKAHHTHRRSGLAQLTTEGMERAKASGVQLGRPCSLPKDTLQLVLELKAGGMSVRKIADKLNADGVATTTGAAWHPTTVQRILERAEVKP